MMTFNKVLAAISLLMVFGQISNSANGLGHECAIKFPEGFFCDVICEHWGVLSGNTIMCFISHFGQYERFVARNTAYGVWRFYQIDKSSSEELVCQYSLLGDEYYLNKTETECIPPLPPSGFFPSKGNIPYRFEEYDLNSLDPAQREGVDSRVPMDAICELATTHICRQGKIISCDGINKCCHKKVSPNTCEEESMSKFKDCYKALYNVMQNITYY